MTDPGRSEGVHRSGTARRDGLRCLVLGGGGFLGLNLCNALAAAGAEVKALGRSAVLPDALDPQVEWVSGNLSDRVALSAAVEGQDIVFHLIGGSVPESSNRDPAAELAAGPLATVYLLDICRAAKVRKLVFASSGGTVYGIPSSVPIPESAPTDPISAYGIGKLVVEKHLHLYLHLHGFDYQVLRIANPYGRFQLGHKKQGLIGTLLYRALHGLPVEIWGRGDVTRDFIHVDDVTAAFLLAIDYEGRHRVMNVGSEVGLSVLQIVDGIEAALGRGPLKRVHQPGRAADVPINVLDTALLRAETGWRPRVSWPDGLKDTIAWMSGLDATVRSPRP